MNRLSGKENPWCLVLSGGGAKGIYHVGAWKALRELGVTVDAFVGNSIGAIIAGFLAQGNEEKMYYIGDNITVDYLLKIPGELSENGELKMSLQNMKAIRKFYGDAFRKGGLDTTPLKKMLDESLDEELIRKSGNDLGVVTFNLSDMKPREIFLDEMEPGTVIDYIMASSAFPGFHNPVIRGKKYIDGGIYDNLPYSMARSRGYRRIIVIDISGMGVNRRPNIEGTETIYIKNSLNMGGVLNFNRNFLNRYRRLGYLDTLRTFGALKGTLFFMERDRKWEKRFVELLEDPGVIASLVPFLEKEYADDIPYLLRIRSILPKSMRHKKEELLYSFLDCCAVSFRLDRIHRYTVEEMINLICKRKEEEEKKLKSLDAVKSRSDIRLLLKRINLIRKDREMRETLKDVPYFNIRLSEKLINKSITLQGRLIRRGLHAIYPELKGALFFLENLNKLLTFK